MLSALIPTMPDILFLNTIFCILQIKRFQRHLVKNLAVVTEERSIPFSFRKSSLKEKLIWRVKNFFGQGDPKDFLMIKFYEVQ